MGALGFGPALALRQAGGRGFDFSGGAMPPGASLARASAATCTGPGGVLASMAADAARFDHDPLSLRRRGLLLEPERTNLLAHADGGVAQLSGGASGASDAPGTLPGFAGAIRIADNAQVRTALKTHAHVGGMAYRISLFVRMDDGLAPAIGDQANQGDFCLLAGGAIQPGVGMTPMGGGLFRIDKHYVSTGADNRFGVIKYTAQSPRGLNLSGFQLEQADSMSSLILSGAAATTRAADVLTLDWGAEGVGDGPLAARVGFDDASSEDVAMTVAAGMAAAPLPLSRSRVRWIVRV